MVYSDTKFNHSVYIMDQSSQLKQFLMQMKDLSYSKMNSDLAV